MLCPQNKEFDSAKKKVLNFLRFRIRTKKEVEDYLKKHKYSEETITNILCYLEKLNLLDDEKFAELFIEEKIRKFWGPLKIKYELLKKGVEKEIIEKKISEKIKEKEMVCSLKEMIRKKIKEEDPTKRNQKIYSFLKRRGFLENIIWEVLKSED